MPMAPLERALDAVARAASHRWAPPVVAAYWLAFRGTPGVDAVEFLMTFVILHSQAKDGQALQAKADALVFHSAAPNDRVGLERKGAAELEEVARR